ncbi:MAG: hypothetical protein ACAI25_20290, partial [Planctomycetota bacterium]
RAEGQALALEKVYGVARTIDDKTMSLQYLQALRSLGAGEATKFVVPMELTNLLRPFVEHTARASGRGEEGEGRIARAA